MLLSIYIFGCSICNTKATSQQTLLAHADGKKHRGKAKAYHARQQQASAQSTVDKKDAIVIENASNGDLDQKNVDIPVSSGVVNGDLHAEKKRKLETLDETSEGEEARGGEVKKAKKQDHEKKISWKKLITSALKSVRIYQFIEFWFRFNLFLATCNIPILPMQRDYII